ncbi:MAG TPA: hypothetical protein PLD23_20070 [Armatimonadota bacterium]|nr:hypothetical protein [Armatimonadota bacterium]
MTRQLVISICGTSLLTNGLGEDLRRELTRYANVGKDDVSPEVWMRIEEHAENRRQELRSAPLERIRELSAELNGIVALYGDTWHAGGAKHDMHLLFHSDTWLGEMAASMAEAWLRQAGVNASLDCRPGLNTTDPHAFRSAMSDLVQWCHKTVPGYRDDGYRIVFCLVGGFKCLVGFMQALGMFYADECVYIFEGTSELLRIPRLPVALDAGVEDAVRQHLDTFRRLEVWKQLPMAECAGIPETLLYPWENECELSPWGNLVWSELRGKLLGEKLLPPPSARVRFGPKLEAACKGLQPDLLARLNGQIGHLCRCIESGGEKGSHNPRHLDLKQLQGKPMDGSTHECDAFGGNDARRLYGHYEGDVFVVDRLGGHL